MVEPMITLGKKPSLANRRLAFDRLRDRGIVEKLFDDLGPRYAKRNGGYLRILKTGFRKGDNAPLALVTLMDRVEQGVEEGRRREEEKATTNRRQEGRQGRLISRGQPLSIPPATQPGLSAMYVGTE